MIAAISCGETPVDDPGGPPPVTAPVRERQDAGARGQWAVRFYEGYLAETTRGDLAAAQTAYAAVLEGAPASDPRSAARAALRLAELELLAGNRRRAQELVARASVLGRDDIEVLERADRAQSRMASLRSSGSEVRGPPAGTELDGVEATTRASFSAAEELLSDYHRKRLQPRLEGVRAGIRVKEGASERAEAAYKEVVALGEREAAVAAEFRIGSLHHDLALALMFDVPPELEAREAAKLRRSLRSRALSHLRRARGAYERSLEAAGGGPVVASTERWRLAADVGLRAVRELLVGSD